MRNVILSFCALATAALAAQAQTWNFEYPGFAPYETTPLINRAPNVGPFTITASFEPASQMFIVPPGDPVYQANGLFSGQCLVAPSWNVLLITFSRPVDSIDFDFAVSAFSDGYRMSWYLPELSAGGFQAATNVGGGQGYWGGHASINGLGGVTQIVMTGLDTNDHLVEFAIDNLAVPTPSAAATLTFAGIASLRRRRS